MNKDKMQMSLEMLNASKRVGKVIKDYRLLEEGDKVLVGVSGGKDSITLLNLLRYRQTFAPIHFDIKAVHIDCDLPQNSVQSLRAYFEEKQYDYCIKKLDLLKGKSWAEINCFWCSWNRRKMLFSLAKEFGFNKIALGHHMDDVVETILLNLFYRGEIAGMNPRQELFSGKLTIIRPLAYERESYIQKIVQKEKFIDIEQFQCPNNDTSKRQKIKALLKEMEADNSDVLKNIFFSLRRIRKDYLLNQEPGKS